MLRKNYHTHTYRCGHAVGEDEDYVIEAIALGLTTLGFSDHVMLDGLKQENVRGDFSLTEDYFSSINYLKEKYRERIDIKLGFEAEPFPEYFEYYRYLLKNNKIDYLILGNHCALQEGKVRYFFSKSTGKEDLIRYRDTLIDGVKTGLFSYIAHPDYFMGGYSKFDRTCKQISEEICDASLKYDVPLEFNFAGIRKGKVKFGFEERYLYPHLDFWKIAKKKNCKVIIGLDAHAPSELSHERNDIGYELVKKLGLNVIDTLELKKI